MAAEAVQEPATLLVLRCRNGEEFPVDASDAQQLPFGYPIDAPLGLLDDYTRVHARHKRGGADAFPDIAAWDRNFMEKKVTDTDTLHDLFVAGMAEQPPQMPCVRHLNLRMNYTEMGDWVPCQIEQILRSFPCLGTLEIMRDNDVTGAEGLLQENDKHIYEEHNFFFGLESFNHHLRWICLAAFRGGKHELALVKAILDKVRAGTRLRMDFSSGSYTEDISDELDLAIRNLGSTTPNDAFRNNLVDIISFWD